MHNYFHVFGRLVTDIEINETSTGKSVGNLKLAVRREFKNFNGEYDTDFLKISLWEGVATNASQYVNKGDQILISGRIVTNKVELSEEKFMNVTELYGEKVTFISGQKQD
ncbi:MAG: single-stranded DNA-binding protein [bacterium]